MITWIQTSRLSIKNSLSLYLGKKCRTGTNKECKYRLIIAQRQGYAINSLFSVRGFIVELAGIQRRVAQIEAVLKEDVFSL